MNSASITSQEVSLVRSDREARWRIPLCIAVVALAVAPTYLAVGYQLFQLTMILVFSIAVLGLNLLIGYNGQLSLGHGAFYALGAYVTAILMTQFGMPYWATIPIAGLVCLVVGMLFGLPALRLEGMYLALATFALAMVTPQLIRYKGFEKWTGGFQGLSLNKPSAPFGLPLSPDQWMYVFVLVIAALLFWLAWNLTRGRIGRAMVAIREQPTAAASMGVNLAFVKAATFGISTMYTGIAGALGAIAVQFVSPDSFAMFLSISLFVGVIVGGLGSISGALFGAAFIQLIPNWADSLSKSAPWAVYGVILILSMFLMPKGFAGVIRSLARRFDRAKSP